MRAALSSLSGRTFDVAVIGAGINGCSAAQQLAARGYTVLLVDKGDFGAASSSRSTRLVHCGLRYLAPGGTMWDLLLSPKKLSTALRMTRQAMVARSEFAKTSASRTRQIKFGFPLYRDGAYRPWQIDLAFTVLKSLGPSEPPLDYQRLGRDEVAASPLFSRLRDQDKLLGVAMFREYQFDWAERVAVDMALDARRIGAVVRNYTPVTGLARATKGDGWTLTLADGRNASEPPVTLTAKVVLNTAGIWIDKVNALAGAGAKRKILGTKGVHVVIRLPPECQDYGVITLNRAGVEPVYLVPWRQGLHYMGVTETVYDGDIDDIQASDGDIDWLLAEANHLVPSLSLKRTDVLYSWAGVRPLQYDPDLPKGFRSRQIHDQTREGMPGVISMTAGPVTTHRSGGIELADAVARHVRPSGTPQPLDYAPRQFPDSGTSPALLNHYPQIKLADLRHAAMHEEPETLVDLLFRRTGLGWTETQAREGAQLAAETVADILGWDRGRIDKEVEAYQAYLAHAHRQPSPA
ncbi:MAG: FAD-dependent oxidoreductase [Alphaproteobacteria bacterium]